MFPEFRRTNLLNWRFAIKNMYGRRTASRRHRLEGPMNMTKLSLLHVLTLAGIAFVIPGGGFAQERLKIAYSSADASNTVWFTALDAGLYRKYGLDAELIFIQSSTMSVSTVVSGDVQVANVSGGAVASAAVGGANLVMTACYINTLPYELVVQESIKSVEDL